MGKKRARLMAIENKKSRSDTFHKRKMGLLKKAAEFSILCDVKLLLLFEDLAENIIQFSAHEHFDPKIYKDKKVIKLSLTDYPDFFQKHGVMNEAGERIVQGGLDGQDSENEEGEDDDDSNSNSSGRPGRSAKDQESAAARNSKTQKEIQDKLALLKDSLANGNMNVKAEHAPEIHQLKIENPTQNIDTSNFKNQFEAIQRSLKNADPKSSTQGMPSMEELQKMMGNPMQKLSRPDPMSMMPNLKDFNPFMGGMNPAAMGMGGSQYPFMGFDPSMMMRNMDPMTMLGMMGAGRPSLPDHMRSKMGDGMGEEPNKWMANYYENYFKQNAEAGGGGGFDPSKFMGDKKGNPGDDAEGNAKKKVKK